MSESDPLTENLREPIHTISRSFVRPGESRLTQWFLFYGSRIQVTIALLLAVFIALMALGAVWEIEYEILLTETRMVQTVFNTLLGGVILLVSIVVSVAALGISQELTTLGEQTDRVDTAIEFRRALERHADLTVSPAQSGQFLAAVLQSVRECADALDHLADEQADSAFHSECAQLLNDIETNARDLLATLERVESGSTDELLTGLDYNCSWQLHQTQRLLTHHVEQLSDDDRQVLEELQASLRYFLIVREYFKSLYYKREFSDLSATLLTVSLPVIVFITYILLAVNAGIYPDTPVPGFSPLAFYVSVAYTIALAPYVVLTAYIIRAVSVTKRTLAAGPFVLETEYEP